MKLGILRGYIRSLRGEAEIVRFTRKRMDKTLGEKSQQTPASYQKVPNMENLQGTSALTPRKLLNITLLNNVAPHASDVTAFNIGIKENLCSSEKTKLDHTSGG